MLNLYKTKKNKAGFTLIELLVVIAIIGLFSSVVMTNLNSAREKARVAKAQEEVRTLYQALVRYNIDTNTWPVNNNIETVAGFNALLSSYMSKIDVDPWGTSYFFDGNPSNECRPGLSSVCSAGHNKVFGSWNRSDMKVQGDDICIYFEPECK